MTFDFNCKDYIYDFPTGALSNQENNVLYMNFCLHGIPADFEFLYVHLLNMLKNKPSCTLVSNHSRFIVLPDLNDLG